MEVTFPGRLRFPEPEHLPPERQQEILQRCIESPRLKALSSRHLLVSRFVWALLAFGAVGLFAGNSLGLSSRMLFWSGQGIIILAIAAWIGAFVWWLRRSSSELRELVAQELQQDRSAE